ncbi:MAG TPA: EamA family transporter RarD [Ideonella sp.]|uniref:EamA family transporter RarD n=1 Tax=Ideonella sp. TaxID=1929293 RepID=UPI002C7636AD|nr:EamA family transporter RarD [Ideonella sp.]HSI52302.1 EamA family transporter RarD [Ideonella sp.]
MNPGVYAAGLAYVCWGLFPLYFHRLSQISAVELIFHRSVWALLCMLLVLGARRQWGWLGPAMRSPRTVATYAASAFLLSINWVLYVWSVHNGHVVEAALGYFINPLVNVLLGVLVLHERPRRLQWAALAVAAAGVAWLGAVAGSPPWIALGLAASFGAYGLLKKTAPLGALEGLTTETLLMAPVAIPALLWLGTHGGDTAQADAMTWVWLLLAGPITAVPLLLFSYGAQRISMATLGLLQYVSPSLQFLLGVLIFREPMQPARLIGFALIWGALMLYSAETLWQRRQVRLQAV